MSRSGTAGSHGNSNFAELFCGTARLFSKPSAPPYHPTSSAGGLPFLHTLTSTWGCLQSISVQFWVAFPWCLMSSFSMESLYIQEQINAGTPNSQYENINLSQRKKRTSHFVKWLFHKQINYFAVWGHREVANLLTSLIIRSWLSHGKCP